jgi:hypothetical protein
MKKNNTKKGLLFIGFFLLVIYAVPVTQAVIEYHKEKHVQVLDLIIDATVTPVRRVHVLHDQSARLSVVSDSMRSVLADTQALNSGRLTELADEALVAVSDLKTEAMKVNRHVMLDSALPQFRIFDTLTQLCNAVYQNADDPHRTVLLDSINLCVQHLAHRYPVSASITMPWLLVDNCKYIFWNDRYLRPYEKEMENASVFAIALRPRMQLVRYMLFKDLGDKGVLGKNGWFFYKPDVDFLVRPYIRDPRSVVIDPNDKVVTDDPLKTIITFKQQLAKRGIDLLVVIVPGKPSIYPDILSPGISPSMSGTFSHSLDMLRDLQSSGVDVVDLFHPFARERFNDAQAGDSLYLQKDTHWRSRAVRLTARLVADRIKQYPWYVPGTTCYTIDSVVVDRVGDIGTMTTLPTLKIRALAATFAPEKTKCYQVYTAQRDALGAVTRQALYKDDFHHSQIIVLGDSYSRIYQTDEPRSAGWISHLAYELSQPMASIVNDGGASTLVRESLSRRVNLLAGKKLVVWEIVERDFRFGEAGWKDISL